MTYPIAYATDERRAELAAMPAPDYALTFEWAQVVHTVLCKNRYACAACGLHATTAVGIGDAVQGASSTMALCVRCAPVEARA